MKSLCSHKATLYGSPLYCGDSIISIESYSREKIPLPLSFDNLSNGTLLAVNGQFAYTSSVNGITKSNLTTGNIMCQFAQDLQCITDICIDNDIVYVSSHNPMTRYCGITAYDSNGKLSDTIAIRGIHSSGISLDCEQHLLHVCDTKNNCIKVYNKLNQHLLTYGMGYIDNPMKIAMHPDGYSVVLESVSLAVFLNGKYLYSIDVSDIGINDLTITSDGALWILIGKTNKVLRLPSLVLYVPPPPLSLLCESTILVHMKELPVSSLPPRYVKLLKEWSQTVSVYVSNSESTKPRVDKCDFKEEIQYESLQIKKDSSESGIRLILEKKLNKPIRRIEYPL